MIDDWAAFITAIKKETKLTNAELARKLEVRPQLISEIETGRSKNPSSDFLLRLINRIGINPSYLAGDTRLFLSSGDISMQEGECAEPENGMTIHRLNGRNAVELSVMKADPEIGYVDFYHDQRAGMGPGKDVQDYAEAVRLPIIRMFLQPYRPDEVRALEARGDSMSKIGIFDRDIVLYVPREQEGDGVYVISRDNKLQVKRLEFDITDRELRIISENDRYQPKILKGDEADGIVIEGKVIGWLHRHPY